MFTTADLPETMQATPHTEHVCGHNPCPFNGATSETAPGVPSRA